MDAQVTFISFEKLGLLATPLQQLATYARKKDRAAEIRFIDNTLRRLGLLKSSASEWSTYAIAIGCDHSGNLGAFIIEDKVILGKSK